MLEEELVESAWPMLFRGEYDYDERDERTRRQFGRDIFQSTRYDRSEGRWLPVYETEYDLSVMRAQSRNIAAFTSISIGALESLSNYVLGTGFKYSFHTETPAAPDGLIADVQQFVDSFRLVNKFDGEDGALDVEMHDRARIDGEALIALHEAADGIPRLSLVEPDCLTEPTSARNLEDWLMDTGNLPSDTASFWKFGVHTIFNPKMQREDTSTPLGYHVVYNESGSEWDYVPAGRMVHDKRNVGRNAKRGVSDFVGIADDIYREVKLRGNMGDTAAIQAAIAWIKEYPQGASSDGIESHTSNLAEFQRTRRSVGGSESVNVQRIRAGHVPNIKQGMRYIAGPMGQLNHPVFARVGAYIMRSIGVRWRMPEYMISGDASNANMASTMVAESPFVKAREDDQRDRKIVHRELFWKAIKMAFDARRWERYGLEWPEFRRVVLLKIDAPQVASRDGLKQAQENQILSREGILSPRTWASQQNLDYDDEVANGAKKAEPANPFGGMFGGDTPVAESLVESFAECCGKPTGSAHVRVARDGTVKLSQPMNPKDASAMLQALNRLHAVIVSDMTDAAGLPANHPDRTAAEERAATMPSLMARAIRMTRPILRESHGGCPHCGPPFRDKALVEESYFATCERDEAGRCVRAGGSKSKSENLSKTPVVKQKPLGGGVSESRLVTLKDGSQAVFKPASGEPSDDHPDGPLRNSITSGTAWQREVAVSAIADELGMSDLVPSTVERQLAPTPGAPKESGSLQEFVPGKVAAKMSESERYDGDHDLARAATLDYVIGNTDRHDGNWLVGDDNKIKLIDNGLSFPHMDDPSDYVNGDLIKQAARKDLIVPQEVSQWRGKWPAVKSHLTRLKLESGAIALAKQRFDTAVSQAGKPFRGIKLPRFSN